MLLWLNGVLPAWKYIILRLGLDSSSQPIQQGSSFQIWRRCSTEETEDACGR